MKKLVFVILILILVLIPVSCFASNTHLDADKLFNVIANTTGFANAPKNPPVITDDMRQIVSSYSNVFILASSLVANRPASVYLVFTNGDFYASRPASAWTWYKSTEDCYFYNYFPSFSELSFHSILLANTEATNGFTFSDANLLTPTILGFYAGLYTNNTLSSFLLEPSTLDFSIVSQPKTSGSIVSDYGESITFDSNIDKFIYDAGNRADVTDFTQLFLEAYHVSDGQIYPYPSDTIFVNNYLSLYDHMLGPIFMPSQLINNLYKWQMQYDRYNTTFVYRLCSGVNTFNTTGTNIVESASFYFTINRTPNGNLTSNEYEIINVVGTENNPTDPPRWK